MWVPKGHEQLFRSVACFLKKIALQKQIAGENAGVSGEHWHMVYLPF